MRAVPSGSGSVYFDGFLARHERLIGELDAAEPLHAGVAFDAGEEQPHGIALLGTQRLAVLSVGDHRVIPRLGDRNAARHHRGVHAFGEKPRRLGRRAGFAQQRRERHADPFARARQAVDLLRREIGLVAFAPIDAAAVARAFHRANHRLAGEAAQIVEREDQRPIDHAVNQQRVLLRIDRRHAAVMALEVEIGRRDDAVEILERRQARRAALAERHALRALERRARADIGAERSLNFRGIGGHLRTRRLIGILSGDRQRCADDSRGSGRQNAPSRDGFRTIHASSLKTLKGNTPSIPVFGPEIVRRNATTELERTVPRNCDKC